MQTEQTLVDVTSQEAAKFLTRGSTDQVALLITLYAAQGIVAKPLDQITDARTLQYLYWNSTQQTPPDDVTALQGECEKLAASVPANETTVEDLNQQVQQLEAEQRRAQAADEQRRYQQYETAAKAIRPPIAVMSFQGWKDEGGPTAEEFYARPEPVKTEGAVMQDTDAGAAQAAATTTAAPETTKTKKKEKTAERKPRATNPEAEQTRKLFESLGTQENARATAEQKAQELYLSQGTLKNGRRKADPERYAIELPLKADANSAAVPTKVSLMWFASAVSGLPTSKFSRKEASGLAEKLGYTIITGEAATRATKTAGEEQQQSTAAASDAQPELPGTAVAASAASVTGEQAAAPVQA